MTVADSLLIVAIASVVAAWLAGSSTSPAIEDQARKIVRMTEAGGEGRANSRRSSAIVASTPCELRQLRHRRASRTLPRISEGGAYEESFAWKT